MKHDELHTLMTVKINGRNDSKRHLEEKIPTPGTSLCTHDTAYAYAESQYSGCHNWSFRR